MSQEFSVFLEQKKSLIETKLHSYVKGLAVPDVLKESMLYSLTAGGKRLRPVMLLATMEALGAGSENGIPVACAIEMIHTYSLVHDDLPAMDNDDLRRGKPTNHRVYGEAMAILAGDALLTYSFQIVAESESIPVDKKAELIALLAKAAGPEGMVGGQAADLEGEDKTLSLEELEYIHHHKTGKLLVYSIIAGALLANATDTQLDHLKQFASHLGLAFQIRDDILDVEGDQEKLGKLPGSDQSNKKSTYPQLLTMEGAKRKLDFHVNEAVNELKSAGVEDTQLKAIADFIIKRDH
nr:farnesyl diphosphate synthase [Pseudalkalibacillus caeni]